MKYFTTMIGRSDGREFLGIWTKIESVGIGGTRREYIYVMYMEI